MSIIYSNSCECDTELYHNATFSFPYYTSFIVILGLHASVLKLSFIVILGLHASALGDRGGAVGWGTALQVRRSRVSIPDGVIGIFHWHNPSGRTMALGSTQPLTEMSTANISWGQKAAGA